MLFVTHDIDESVYLGQRVLVMSHAPTVIMEDVAIDLPDERTQLETRSMARFGELAQAHLFEDPACQARLAATGLNFRPPRATSLYFAGHNGLACAEMAHFSALVISYTI